MPNTSEGPAEPTAALTTEESERLRRLARSYERAALADVDREALRARLAALHRQVLAVLAASEAGARPPRARRGAMTRKMQDVLR